MTSSDDRLARVTPLFGGDHPAARGGRRGSSPRDESEPFAEGGWAAPGTVGSDEDASEATREVAAPVRRLPTFETFWPSEGEAAERADPDRTDDVRGARQGPRTRDGSTDGRSAVGRSTSGRSAGSPSNDDDAANADEPAESLEAAARRAENISMHALTRRGVSSREMERTLSSRDLPADIVAAEIERLQGVGLLNDGELAETLVRSKQERKGLGKTAIAAELRQRGIADEAIQQAVAEIDDDDEQARADEWARKRAGQLRGLDHETASRRLSAFLMRRGYRSETVRCAVDAALPRGGSSRGGVRFE